MMRLSEAIRLGATMKPQAYSGLSIDSSCALAAAAEAIGLKRIPTKKGELLNYDELRKRFPISFSKVPCPQCGDMFGGFQEEHILVYHLNDSHLWTRERIADFVELHEPLPVAEVQPESVEVA